MKQVLPVFFLLISIGCLAQVGDPANNLTGKKSKKVSFVTRIDINQATKDGIYLEGYIVNIDYEKIRALNGKTVRISGKVSIVKGIEQNTSGELVQGREDDTRHIFRPRIKLVGN